MSAKKKLLLQRFPKMNEITENCPFCGLGGELLRVVSVSDQRNVQFFVVRCDHCLADGPMSLDPDAAVFYWNKRNEQVVSD